MPKNEKGIADPAGLSGVERRLYVRSVFSFIEAAVFRIKAWSLGWDTNRLSPGEIGLAKEEDYELDESGEVKIRKARLRFLSNLRFAFAVAAKAAEVEFHLDVGGTGWQALGASLPVRDRLTHPKRMVDLVVTDNEVGQCMTAFHWVLDEMERISARALLKHLRTKSADPNA